MLTGETLGRAGIDAVALKPAERDLKAAFELGVRSIVVDYEGREHFPDAGTLSALTEDFELLVTTPIRADGFDPLGDDGVVKRLPATATRVLVAGNGAYLTESEERRAIAPRLKAAHEAAPDAWIGTEGIERLALAAGGTQFELLARNTGNKVAALRDVGFDGEIAVYAPTVLTDDPDETLEAVGDFIARREPVRRALPDDATTDASAAGRTRELLLKAATDYALVGDVETVRDRVETLEAAGVDRIVAYPARGLDAFR